MMKREDEIRGRLAQADYRSPWFPVYGEDIKYLLAKVETFEQVRAELESMWEARVQVLESVVNSLTDRNAVVEKELADLKAALITEKVSDGTEEAGQADGVNQAEGTDEPPASGSEEQAPMGGGAAGDLVPEDGSQEPDSPALGNGS